MTGKELDILIEKVQTRADETCGADEIRKKIQAGYSYVNGKFNEHVGSSGSSMLFLEPENTGNFTENVDSQDDITEHTIGALPLMPRSIYTHLHPLLLTITDTANTDSMGLIFVKHSLLLFILQPGEVKESQPAQSNEEVLYILCDMPDEFTWME